MDEDPHDEWPIFAVWEDYLAKTEFERPTLIFFNPCPYVIEFEIIKTYVIR